MRTLPIQSLTRSEYMRAALDERAGQDEFNLSCTVRMKMPKKAS